MRAAQLALAAAMACDLTDLIQIRLQHPEFVQMCREGGVEMDHVENMTICVTDDAIAEYQTEEGKVLEQK